MKKLSFIILSLLFFSCCTMQQRRTIVNRGLASLVEVKYMSTVGGPASGSGCIVDKEKGLILTNKHMAPIGAVSFVVVDKQSSLARVIYRDRVLDIAVLEIEDKKILKNRLPIMFANNSKVGDDVYVLGHPFQFNNIVTKGIISGKFNDILLLDAVLNPGNSGGLVINSNGKLVGVSFAIDMRTFHNNTFSKSGLSYAVNALVVREKLRILKIIE